MACRGEESGAKSYFILTGGHDGKAKSFPNGLRNLWSSFAGKLMRNLFPAAPPLKNSWRRLEVLSCRDARVGDAEARLKGRKVPPKYRDRAGNTWAGRGAKPRWLVAAIKEGKKLEDFAVEKTAKKRRAKKK